MSSVVLRPYPEVGRETAGTPQTIGQLIDRWVFFGMAAFFVAIVLAGFLPDSAEKMAAVAAGKRAPFPPILHVHAVLMGSFLTLLLAQTWLGATGRTRLHRRLGVLAFAIAPALVVAGALLVPTMYGEVLDSWRAAPPGARAEIEAVLARRENVALVQLRMGILFPLLLAVGLWARRRDAGLHKRLMILAVAAVLPPAIDRIHWLPSTFPTSFVATEAYMLVAIAPMLFWDLARTRRIHAAYWMYAGITMPFALALHLAWDTPWWHAAARRLLGA